MAARARDWPHRARRGDEEEHEHPQIHWDNCLPRNAEGGEYVVVRVGRDRDTKMMVAHLVLTKEWRTSGYASK